VSCVTGFMFQVSGALFSRFGDYECNLRLKSNRHNNQSENNLQQQNNNKHNNQAGGELVLFLFRFFYFCKLWCFCAWSVTTSNNQLQKTMKNNKQQ
jgi:hypothetical protein